MSEHTLDDLAARLAALGWAIDYPEKTVLRLVRIPELRSHEICLTVWSNGDTYFGEYRGGDGTPVGPSEMTPEIIETFVRIRQWQASAEPAPPVVIDADYLADLLFYAIRDHLTVDMFRSLVAPDTMEWSGPSVEAQTAMNAIARDVCFALRGADLAPESGGARDGQ